MKTRFIFLFAASAVITAACNNNPASKTAGSTTDTSLAVSAAPAPDTSKDQNKAQEALASVSDSQFLADVYSTGEFEIKAGRLAHRISVNSKVKSFGTSMVEAHEALNKEVLALLQKKGYAVPGTLPQDMKDSYKNLNNLMDKPFDELYAQANVDGHKHAMDLCRAVLTVTRDADVKQFAEATLPKLEHHEEMAKALQTEVKSE